VNRITVSLAAIFTGILLANLAGCAWFGCTEQNDFLAYTFSALVGPMFPFFTPPVVSESSGRITYTVFCVGIVAITIALLRKLALSVALAGGIIAWSLIGLISLSLYRF
jgi:hypothetical protein